MSSKCQLYGRHLVDAYEVKMQAWWKVMAAYH